MNGIHEVGSSILPGSTKLFAGLINVGNANETARLDGAVKIMYSCYINFAQAVGQE